MLLNYSSCQKPYLDQLTEEKECACSPNDVKSVFSPPFPDPLQKISEMCASIGESFTEIKNIRSVSEEFRGSCNDHRESVSLKLQSVSEKIPQSLNIKQSIHSVSERLKSGKE